MAVGFVLFFEEGLYCYELPRNDSAASHIIHMVVLHFLLPQGYLLSFLKFFFLMFSLSHLFGSMLFSLHVIIFSLFLFSCGKFLVSSCVVRKDARNSFYTTNLFYANKLIYLVVLGLHYYAGFSSCSIKGLLILVVHRLLTIVAFLVQHGIWGTWASEAVVHGLSNCGFHALDHRLNDCGSQA